MLLYKLEIERFSGDTMGVSQKHYIEKRFKDEEEFKKYKKEMNEYDYDGSYAEVYVKEVVKIND